MSALTADDVNKMKVTELRVRYSPVWPVLLGRLRLSRNSRC